MQLSPVVEREIDDGQSASGHFLPQAFTRFDIARGDEQQRDRVQAGIVAQDKEAVGGGRRSLDNAKDVVGRCVVKLFYRSGGRGRLEGGSGKFPRFLRALGRGCHHAVGNQRVGGHIGTDSRGILLSPFHQPACTVFRARFGTFGLGVTK